MEDNTQKKFVHALLHKRVLFPLIMIGYVAVLLWQLNIWPLERYPEWDHFWADTRMAGTLESLRLALEQGELPFIVPYTSFGWNLVGNHYSFFSPTNFLIMVLSDPARVMMVTQFLYLTLGALGAFYFIRHITKRELLALYGGILYVSIPFVISVYAFQGTYYNFYHIPFFLFLIHRLLDRFTPLRLFLFTAYSALVVASTDIYAFTIFPVFSLVYTAICARGYYGFSLFRALRSGAGLTAVFFLASSFYLIPLAQNLKFINWSSALVDAGVLGTASGGKTAGFLPFFMENGFSSLFIPFEGSGLFLYIPLFFYLACVAALGLYFFQRIAHVEREKKQLVIVGALFSIGILLFMESMMLYSSAFQHILSLISPDSMDAVRGKLRVQLNGIPFVSLLAGVISFSVLYALPTKKMLAFCFGSIAAIAAIADYVFHGIFWEPLIRYRSYTYGVVKGVFEKGTMEMTKLTFFYPNTLEMYILISLALLILFFLIICWDRFTPLKRSFFAALGFGALFFFPLAFISSIMIGMQTQDNVNKMKLRSKTHMTIYQQLNSCLEKVVSGKDYRILYTGAGNVNSQNGRDWKLIALTELHVAEKKKVLISYREFEDGYTALLMNILNNFTGGWQASNIFPPLTSEALSHIPLLRLMGVRFIMSAHTLVNDPQLKQIGFCKIKGEGPISPNEKERKDGIVYVDMVKDYRGISFLARDFEIHSQREALQELVKGKRFPWDEGVVYVEKQPLPTQKAEIGEQGGSRIPLKEFSKIEKESFQSFSVRAGARADTFLVVSYLYRPEWKAYLDSSARPLEIYRAYGGFMAVSIPAGEHTVAFRYQNPYPLAGAVLTSFAFLPPIGMMIATRRKRKRKQQ